MRFPVEKLLWWYEANKREMPWRENTEIYRVWVSEMMLQQTQVATVIPYYLRFMERFPTVAALAEGEEQDVLKLWEGLGYYSRIRNFHKAARMVMTRYDGVVPTTEKEFLTLPGVGPYIAAAVLSISQNRPLPTVDGNVLRVCARFYGIPDDIRKTGTRNDVFKRLQAVIPHERPGDFNQGVMELGALVCTPKKPACPSCPLGETCTAFTTDTIRLYPYKSPAAKAPTYKVAIAVIVAEDKFYIQKRASSGHLGGLWEFPGGKVEAGETPEGALVRECREELACEVEIIDPLPVVRHAYSHFKIEMTPYICALKGDEPKPTDELPFTWITIQQLDQYPFPGANHKLFPHLKTYLKNRNR